MRKKALVLGGHSPIAIAISKKLSENYDVLHVTRSPDSQLMDSFDTKLEIEIVELDLLDEKQVSSLIENELIQKGHTIETIVFAHKSGPATISEAIRLEVEAPIYVIDKIIKHQTKGDLKSVVFLSSPAASSVLVDQELPYHLSKASLIQAIRYLSVKYGKLGVRLNAVSPGSFVSKPRSRNYYNINSEYKQKIMDFVPSGDFIHPENIADTVFFLSSNLSVGINGQNINIDGGYSNLESSGYFISNNRPTT